MEVGIIIARLYVKLQELYCYIATLVELSRNTETIVRSVSGRVSEHVYAFLHMRSFATRRDRSVIGKSH